LPHFHKVHLKEVEEAIIFITLRMVSILVSAIGDAGNTCLVKWYKCDMKVLLVCIMSGDTIFTVIRCGTIEKVVKKLHIVSNFWPLPFEPFTSGACCLGYMESILKT
jgi:hypothetical protein